MSAMSEKKFYTVTEFATELAAAGIPFSEWHLYQLINQGVIKKAEEFSGHQIYLSRKVVMYYVDKIRSGLTKHHIFGTKRGVNKRKKVKQ